LGLQNWESRFALKKAAAETPDRSLGARPEYPDRPLDPTTQT
jgi:hypothetical protein